MTTRERDLRLSELSREQLTELLTSLHEAMWPPADVDAPWSPDTLDEMAWVFERYGLRSA